MSQASYWAWASVTSSGAMQSATVSQACSPTSQSRTSSRASPLLGGTTLFAPPLLRTCTTWPSTGGSNMAVLHGHLAPDGLAHNTFTCELHEQADQTSRKGMLVEGLQEQQHAATTTSSGRDTRCCLQGPLRGLPEHAVREASRVG
mmetsp:Transcript_145605/g.465284  ORF Transcript_145605/g.465284 Transcript_145605/m.465284 type:complete len:146 (-) Transcript_145605:26-463(-)